MFIYTNHLQSQNKAVPSAVTRYCTTVSQHVKLIMEPNSINHGSQLKK